MGSRAGDQWRPDPPGPAHPVVAEQAADPEGAVLPLSLTYPSQARTTSRSFASTCTPGFTSTSATVPSASARTLVSIFIASIVSSRSPFATFCTDDGFHRGDGAGHRRADMFGIAGSILRCGGRLATCERSVTTIERGWPLSSKNTWRVPSSRTSDSATKRTMSVLPRSMSTLTLRHPAPCRRKTPAWAGWRSRRTRRDRVA